MKKNPFAVQLLNFVIKKINFYLRLDKLINNLKVLKKF